MRDFPAGTGRCSGLCMQDVYLSSVRCSFVVLLFVVLLFVVLSFVLYSFSFARCSFVLYSSVLFLFCFWDYGFFDVIQQIRLSPLPYAAGKGAGLFNLMRLVRWVFDLQQLLCRVDLSSGIALQTLRHIAFTLASVLPF